LLKRIWVYVALSSLFISSCQLGEIITSTKPTSLDNVQNNSPATEISNTNNTPGIVEPGGNLVPGIEVSPELITVTQTSDEEATSVSEGMTVIRSANTPLYLLQPGSPVYSPNFIIPEQGCDWMGVGGQVFSHSGQTVAGLIIEVDGNLEGQSVLALGMTGTASGFGPGGYLLEISNHTVETQGALWLQVFDINGIPQTDKIFFNTYADCNSNLVIMNFNELGSELIEQFFLPLVYR
jgi:hypothetical protein